jgi:superfamily II DNA or RNA helicase
MPKYTIRSKNNSGDSKILINIDIEKNNANELIKPKEFNLENIIQKYIDSRISLIDIIKNEAPTNKYLQSKLIETYSQLIKLNITTILEEDKINGLENEEQNMDEHNPYSDIDYTDDENIDDDIPDNTNDENIEKINKYRNDLQTKYINEAITTLDKNKRIILKGPTGFGKTVINYKLIDHYNENITMIITPRRILNEQTLEDKYKKHLTKGEYKIYNYSPLNGTKSKGRFDRLLNSIKYNSRKGNKLIILTCTNSCKNLFTKLEIQKINIGLVICDEAHVISGWGNLNKEYNKIFFNTDVKTYYKIFDKYIFTTATPTPDMIHNTALFGNVIEYVQIYELINSRILCDFETIVKHIDFENKTPDMADFIMNIMNKHKKRKGIIYVNSQKNAINMYAHFKTLYPNYKTFIYISERLTQAKFNTIGNIVFSNIDTNIKEFKKCIQPAIIITCNKISYGYDDYNIDLVCFGDPRQSDTEIRQIIGRGLRNDLVMYSNKVLHVVLPITEKILNISSVEKKDDARMELDFEMEKDLRKEYEKIKNFILFIVNECGKDIIDGRIFSSLEENANSDNNSILEDVENNNKTYLGDKIPFQICRELCTTLYNKYSKFLGFLRYKKVYNETTYNQLREKEQLPEWMPVLGDVRKRFKKFCFKDINAPENAGYYDTLVECNNAYEKIKQETIVELGGMIKVKKMLKSSFEKKLLDNIKIKDSKIPTNIDLFYYDDKKEKINSNE